MSKSAGSSSLYWIGGSLALRLERHRSTLVAGGNRRAELGVLVAARAARSVLILGKRRSTQQKREGRRYDVARHGSLLRYPAIRESISRGRTASDRLHRSSIAISEALPPAAAVLIETDLLQREAAEIVRAAGLRPGAGEAGAAERLRADHRADDVAVDVDVADRQPRRRPGAAVSSMRLWMPRVRP